MWRRQPLLKRASWASTPTRTLHTGELPTRLKCRNSQPLQRRPMFAPLELYRRLRPSNSSSRPRTLENGSRFWLRLGTMNRFQSSCTGRHLSREPRQGGSQRSRSRENCDLETLISWCPPRLERLKKTCIGTLWSQTFDCRQLELVSEMECCVVTAPRLVLTSMRALKKDTSPLRAHSRRVSIWRMP